MADARIVGVNEFGNTSLHLESLKQKLKSASPQNEIRVPKSLVLFGSSCELMGLDGTPEEENALLGSGGFGNVYSYFDPKINRFFAVKFLQPTLGTSMAAKELLNAEGELLGRIQFSGVVPVIGAGIISDQPFYAMRIINGWTLYDCIRNKDDGEVFELSLRRRLKLFLSICDTIANAHSKGVCHGDIKSQNVMLEEDGSVFVLDWSIASFQLLQTLNQFKLDGFGSPAYRAPEQAQNEAGDKRTDVYLLGSLLFELLTNTAPHIQPEFENLSPVERDLRILKAPIDEETPCAKQRCPSVPSELASICKMAMTKSVEERGQACPSVPALRKEVDNWLNGGFVKMHNYNVFATAKKAVHRFPWQFLLSLTIFFAIIFGAIIWRSGKLSLALARTEKNLADAEKNRVRELAQARLDSAIDAWDTSINSTSESLEELGGSQKLRKGLLSFGIEKLSQLIEAVNTERGEISLLKQRYNVAWYRFHENLERNLARSEFLEIHNSLMSFEVKGIFILRLKSNVLKELFLCDYELGNVDQLSDWLKELQNLSKSWQSLAEECRLDKRFFNTNLALCELYFYYLTNSDKYFRLAESIDKNGLADFGELLASLDSEKISIPEYIENQAKVLSQHDWRQTAIELLRSKLVSDRVRLRKELSYAFQSNGNFDRAIELNDSNAQDLKHLIAIRGRLRHRVSYAGALGRRAELYRRIKDFDASLINYEKAEAELIKLKSGYPGHAEIEESLSEMKFNKALVLIDLNQTERALTIFEAIVENYKDSSLDDLNAAELIDRSLTLKAMAKAELKLGQVEKSLVHQVSSIEHRLKVVKKQPANSKNVIECSNIIRELDKSLSNFDNSDRKMVKDTTSIVRLEFDKVFLARSEEWTEHLSGEAKGYLAISYSIIGKRAGNEEYFSRAFQIVDSISELSGAKIASLRKLISDNKQLSNLN